MKFEVGSKNKIKIQTLNIINKDDKSKKIIL